MRAMRVLVSGGGGRLGSLLVPWLREHGCEVAAPPRDETDWSRRQQVDSTMFGYAPDRVIALASWTDVAKAQHQPAACVRDTVLTTQHTVDVATALGIPIFYVSTDYVHAVLRQDAAGVYAASKLVAEQMVLLAGGFVARVAFTTDEQVAGWQWANDYSLANRCWLDELVPMLGTWCIWPSHQLERLVELGGPRPCTPAMLLERRNPSHPALRRRVKSQDEARSAGLPVQPGDTSWRSSNRPGKS